MYNQENSPTGLELGDEHSLNEFIALMDYLLSSSTGQSPSAAVSSTETQDQIFAPPFLPSDRVQESLFSPLNFSQGFDRHTIDTHAVQPSAVFPLTVPIYPQTFEQIPPTSRRLRGPARHSIRPKNFQCSDCGRSYDRSSRAQTCENNHLGVKKYRCFGRCGELLCPKTYASPSGLDRHCLPYPERAVSCDDCGRKITRHNMARHQRVCGARL